ncbi:MAG: putative BsuMI modification methylase subunit YdiP [Planctomycetes bacterium]|nr:putative BsuMI modification methylase subunit YdiP [Planctomycetota bacterium]
MVLPKAANRVVGLFAGIGGVEVGLSRAGFATTFLCEIDAAARAVLAERLPGVPAHADIRDLRSVPSCEILAAGFPCQDLSQAGRTAGIDGARSGLVQHVFRLLDQADPTWLILENVPFMLSLDKGEAMRRLTSELASRGYSWAYRVVDSRAFGLPQRRQRVFLVASRTEAPWDVLLADDSGEPEPIDPAGRACGFYWTEGVRGLGWAVDAVPTLKGGSTIGIPSPPAIWMPDGRIVTPDIRDAERLQGFPADWTSAAAGAAPRGAAQRWKLIGNAVSTPAFEWIGRRLTSPGRYDSRRDAPISAGGSWPTAAWGHGADVRASDVSMWPSRVRRPRLRTFLEHPVRLLSERATAGFLSRTKRSSLRFVPGFLVAVEAHLEVVRARPAHAEVG